jgi:EAL domain-containing protein (putative c-di-GMP-specific phosphodiesterase class I)
MLKDFLERLLSWIPVELLRIGGHPAPLVRYHLDIAKDERAKPSQLDRSDRKRPVAGTPAAIEPIPSGQDRRAAAASSARQGTQPAAKHPVKATAGPRRPARSPRGEAAAGRAVTLQDAALEFLYQPKIDLKKGSLAGVEIVPQIRHPALGLITSTAFLSQASEAERQRYGLLAIRTALSDWEALRQIGLNVKFSVAVAIDVFKLPAIAGLLRDTRPDDENWPGLILELSMSEVMPAIPVLQAAAHELPKHNIHFALSGLRLADVLDPALRTLPVAEIKLWNSFVVHAQEQPILTNACRSLVNFAHASKANAVVAGLEHDDGLVWANTLGFDIGQGNLLAAPTTRAGLIAMLQ